MANADMCEHDWPGSGCVKCRAERDKYVKTYPDLTPREDAIITQLIEECAEIIQMATKVKRFGEMEVKPGQDLTNRDRLSMEVGNLQEILDRCYNAGLLSDGMVFAGVEEKRRKLAKYEPLI